MADDPTPGELRIMFSNLLTSLEDIKTRMATQEFVNAKFDAFHDRVKRLEDDQKEWTKVSTEAHVSLDKDSRARHAETQADLESLEVKFNTRVDKIVDEQRASEKQVKAVWNGRITTWIGIALTWLGGLALFFIERSQP